MEEEENAGSAVEDVDASVDEEVTAAEEVGALAADSDLVADVVVVKAELEEEGMLEVQGDTF